MSELKISDAEPPRLAAGAQVVQYIGGPYDGRREVVYGRDPPMALILTDIMEGRDPGEYRRSVRCADDGILRYTWQTRGGSPSEAEVAAKLP
jgi:hypothetical protein